MKRDEDCLMSDAEACPANEWATNKSRRLRRKPSLDHSPYCKTRPKKPAASSPLILKRASSLPASTFRWSAAVDDGTTAGPDDRWSSRYIFPSCESPCIEEGKNERRGDAWTYCRSSSSSSAQCHGKVDRHQQYHRRYDSSQSNASPLPSLAEEKEGKKNTVRIDVVPPADETQPLLRADDKCHVDASAEEQRRLLRVAAAFLMDHEASRAPTLPPDSDDVSSVHLALHGVRFSVWWRIVMAVSIFCLFLASCYEGGDAEATGWDRDYASGEDSSLLVTAATRRRRETRLVLLALTFVPVLVFTLDMLMMKYLFGQKLMMAVTASSSGPSSTLRFIGSSEYGGCVQAFLSGSSLAETRARKSRSRWWALPLTAFLIALSVETVTSVWEGNGHRARQIWSSAFKPIVLFYASPKARNALDAMNRVSRIVFKVLFIEFFTIFTFAAVACQLYGNEFSTFGGLSESFLSMIEVSTLVATPGLWLPVVAELPVAAIFFVMYLVVCVFFLHSLVLSVVFQSYMDGLMIIRERTASDKEETLRLAFQTLYRLDAHRIAQTHNDEAITIETKSVRRVLVVLRPYYPKSNINALLKIVDPTSNGVVNYDSFRVNVPKAMNSAVKVRMAHPRGASFSMYEVFAALLALINFIYVLLASSMYEPRWWMRAIVPVGGAISTLCITDLVNRLIFVKTYTLDGCLRPNLTFDGFSVLAAVVSVVGLTLVPIEFERSLDCLILGRAIDMIRCLRLLKEARGIIRRSAEVAPHVVGPVVLLVSALHIFTYVGMALWGGTVHVGSNGDVAPYFDMNNFNDYLSGMLTMFQLMVANDWHLIAEVFVEPSGHMKHFVFLFFVGANVIIVSILLNVLTAFFMGAFVAKVTWRNATERARSSRAKASNDGEVPILPRSIRGVGFERGTFEGEEDRSSEISSYDVTVSERKGFDSVMLDVAGKDRTEDDTAKDLCYLLELYHALLGANDPDPNVGYLISCHQRKSMFGNQNFRELTKKYMDDFSMHSCVYDMHEELAKLPNAHKTSVHREFQPLTGVDGVEFGCTLDLSASLLKEGSTIALFLAKERLSNRGMG